MHVTVGAVPVASLAGSAPGEGSAAIAARVDRARALQAARYAALRGVRCNAHASGRWIDAHGAIDPEARAVLAAAAERLALSARGYHRVLKVARTIADLDGDTRVGPPAVAEALRYRVTTTNVAHGSAPSRGGARLALGAKRAS